MFACKNPVVLAIMLPISVASLTGCGTVSKLHSWPFEAWDQTFNSGGVSTRTVHHPAGHEAVWYNGVSFNGTAGWIAAAVGFALFVVAAAAAG